MTPNNQSSLLVGSDDGIVDIAQPLFIEMREPAFNAFLQLEDAVFVVAKFDVDDGLRQGMENRVSRLVFAEASVLVTEYLVQRRRLIGW